MAKRLILAGIMLLSFFVLSLSGCSFSVPDTRRVTIVFPDSPDSANARVGHRSLVESVQEDSVDLISDSTPFAWMSRTGVISPIATVTDGSAVGAISPGAGTTFTLPASARGFSCFGINVSGPGIAANSRARSCGDPNSLPVGTIAGLVSVDRNSISMDVPMGPSRVIQLFAMQSTGGCPDFAALDSGRSVTSATAASVPAAQMTLGSPYELGRTTVDIVDDTEVTIQARWNAASPMRAFCYNQSTASPSPSPSAIASGVPGVHLELFDPDASGTLGGSSWFGLTNGKLGDRFPHRVGVKALNSQGAVATNFSSTVTFGYSYDSSCNSTALGNTGEDSLQIPSSGLTAGQITYSNLPLILPGTVYLRAQATGAIPACVGPISVGYSDPSRLRILGPSTMQPGIAAPMRVQLFDQADTPIHLGSYIYADAQRALSFGFNYSMNSFMNNLGSPVWRTDTNPSYQQSAGPYVLPSSLSSVEFNLIASPTPIPSDWVNLSFSLSGLNLVNANSTVSVLSAQRTIRVVPSLNSPAALRISRAAVDSTWGHNGLVSQCSPFRVAVVDLQGNETSLVGYPDVIVSFTEDDQTSVQGVSYYQDSDCRESLVANPQLSGSSSGLNFYVRSDSPGFKMIPARDTNGQVEKSTFLMAYYDWPGPQPTQLIAGVDWNEESMSDDTTCHLLWVGLTDEAFQPSAATSSLTVDLTGNLLGNTAADPANSPGFYGDSSCSNNYQIYTLSFAAAEAAKPIWVKKRSTGRWQLRLTPRVQTIRSAIANLFY